jgi:C-terminal processing protease CtpA/Prc
MEMRHINELTSLTGYKTHDYVIKHEMMGDIFYIDLRLSTPGKDISTVANEIKKAVALGTKKFIIDLRGHGGGDSVVGETLLKAMGIRKIPAHGAIVRISPLMAKQTYGVFHGICGPILKRLFPKGIRYKRSVSTVNPNNVFISVLTDSLTYSAGTMLAVWVQDGKLGNVIGTPSRNSPTYFANMLQAVMPCSKICFRVSCKQFLRPNEKANPDTLIPDIAVNPKDALETALFHLRG